MLTIALLLASKVDARVPFMRAEVPGKNSTINHLNLVTTISDFYVNRIWCFFTRICDGYFSNSNSYVSINPAITHVSCEDC